MKSLSQVIGHIKEYVDHFHDKIESFSVEAANEEAAQSLVDGELNFLFAVVSLNPRRH